MKKASDVSVYVAALLTALLMQRAEVFFCSFLSILYCESTNYFALRKFLLA